MERMRIKLKKWMPNRQLLILKVLLFLYFGGTHSLIPYLVVHMRQIGIDVNQTAIIHAILPIAMFIGPPVSGFLADKSGGFRILLFVCMILTGVLHTCLLLVPTVAPATQLERTWLNCSDTDVDINFELPMQTSCLTTELNTVRLANCRTNCPPLSYLDDKNQTEDQRVHQMCALSTFSTSSVCVLMLDTGKYLATTNPSAFVNDTVRHFGVRDAINVTSECGRLMPNANCTISCDMPDNFDSFHSTPCGNEVTTFWVYLVIRVVAAIFMSSCFVLLDAITLILIKDGDTDYGKQRIWPVIATAVFPPITGALVDRLSTSEDNPNYTPTFYVHDVLLLLTALLSPLLSLKAKFSSETNLKAVLTMAQSPRTDFLIVSLFFLGTMWGFVEVFLYLYLLDLGSPKYLLGLTLTVGSGVGIPVLFFSGYLINKFGHVPIMFVAFIFYAIRYIGYSFMYDPWLCLIFEAMEIFTLHLLWVAAVKYSSTLAPKGLQATMQGAVGGTHYGVGRGSGSLIGGLLMGRFGARATFLYMGVASAVAGLIYLIVEKTFFRKPFVPEADNTKKEDEEVGNVKPVNGTSNNMEISTISGRKEPLEEIRL